METVAELERKLAAAKAEQSERFADRQKQFREAVKVAIAARDKRDRLRTEWQKLDEQRPAQCELCARIARQLEQLDQTIQSGFECGVDVRTDTQRAADDRKRNRLSAQVEDERTRLAQLNAARGAAFAQWLDQRRIFADLDWRAAQLRPLSESELRDLNHTVLDGMGKLSGVELA